MTITTNHTLHRYPFAAACHLFGDAQARDQWLHHANSNRVCPYDTLRTLHAKADGGR